MPFGSTYAWRSVDVFEKDGDTLILQQKMKLYDNRNAGTTTLPLNEHCVVDPLSRSVVNEFTFE